MSAVYLYGLYNKGNLIFKANKHQQVVHTLKTVYLNQGYNTPCKKFFCTYADTPAFFIYISGKPVCRENEKYEA